MRKSQILSSEKSSRMNVTFEGDVVRVKSKRNALPPPSRSNIPSKLSTSINVDDSGQRSNDDRSPVALSQETFNHVDQQGRPSKARKTPRKESLSPSEDFGPRKQSITSPVIDADTLLHPSLESGIRQSILSNDQKATLTMPIPPISKQDESQPRQSKAQKSPRKPSLSNAEDEMMKQLDSSLIVPDLVVNEPGPVQKGKARRRKSLEEITEVEKDKEQLDINFPEKDKRYSSQFLGERENSDSMPKALLKSFKSNLAHKSRSSMVPNPKIKDQRMAESIEFGNAYANVTEVEIVDTRKKKQVP